jgi:hypothetical protein
VLVAATALIAIACILASVRRLAWIVAPTAFDHGLLAEALRKDGRGLENAFTSELPPGWERDLLESFGERDARAREALLGECMTDLDARTQRWARVPRVCASMAARAGFLFACIAILRTLMPSDGGRPIALGDALPPALNALCVGIAATAFCAAVHVRGRVAGRARQAGTERFLQRLEALTRA